MRWQSVKNLFFKLVYRDESTTKDYITAKHNVQSVSYLLCTQVIKPQIIQKPQNQSCTQIYKKHKHRTQNFQRIRPFGITPVKKACKARTRWYRGPFRRFINTSNTRFLKRYKKGMDRSNKKIYKCITANTSVIWQHAEHTTDQLTSPNCQTGAIQKSLSLNEKY